MLSKSPLVSIIIPVKSINQFIIDENLPSLMLQRYKNFEVIVLPNQTSADDDVLKIRYPFLRIIPTRNVSRPAEKRNIGAQNSRGEILAFIDDDAYTTPRWLEKSIPLFDKKSAAAVCGPGLTPPKAPFMERVFEAILTSRLGSGPTIYRFQPGKARFVDDFPSMNLLIRKEIFFAAGTFQHDYWPGEDSKLCEVIVHQLKQRIYYSPEVIVYHHRRPSLIKFLKQHIEYGKHRGAFFGHGDKSSRRFGYLIPSLFSVYIIALGSTAGVLLYKSTAYPIIYLIIVGIPFIIYLMLSINLVFTTLRKFKNPFIAILAPLIVFLMHISYGIAFIIGFIQRNSKYSRQVKSLTSKHGARKIRVPKISVNVFSRHLRKIR